MLAEIDEIESERVDDIPLLLAVLREMGIIDIFNEQIKRHGNWEGLGIGYIIAVWLTYILSEGDHRKSYLQDWVAEREHTLLHSLAVAEINELDFTDDRLGLILDKLSDDQIWQASEREVNQRIIRVYDLEPEIARVDTTTANSYGPVTEDGVLQFGPSKDHRPDLGQVKIASVTLDPLGLPLVTVPVSGEQADDPLYTPVIEQARQSLNGRQGLLYVGDSKMGALATRRELAYGQDYYLMPLSKVQVKAEQMAEYVALWTAMAADFPQKERVTVIDEKGKERLLAEGFTVTVELEDERQEGEKTIRHRWTERRFVILSPEYAQKQQRELSQRLAATEAAVLNLVERRRGYAYPETKEELAQRVDKILWEAGCEEFLTVQINEETVCKPIRAYKGRPAREETSVLFHLQVSRNEEALTSALRSLGWRVYATNAPEGRLSLTQAVEVYRDAYLHEHGYSRLKGRPLSLTPMYLQKDEQITGLIRLLSLALRVLTLVEFKVRQQLAEAKSELAGIYPGNRRRKTKTPRTETLLEVFKGVTLTIIHIEEQVRVHLTPLSATQKRILQLLGLTEEVYTRLMPQFAKVVLKSAN
jgi:transposase